ncbi:MAG: NYN domain-containing protein [Acidimicrobiales bacterium]
MAAQHIVVDGSNIATEGRSIPSLKQLEDAVAEVRREHPGAEVTVIVDATFAHRIDSSELERFEKAALEGGYVYPPAGAIGRGDAFLLRVAEKVDATVLSNDSFQEFHGEHPWLFERGRLLGATPVPGIGWIFSPRTPVRGPTSRQAVRETEKAKRAVTKAIKVATREAVAPPVILGPKPKIGDRRVLRPIPATLAQAPPPPREALALHEVPSAHEVQDPRTGPDEHGRSARLAHVTHQIPAAVNDPLTFVSFIAQHPLGAEVTGAVDSYTSHGAVVMVGTTQCYVPLANLGDPAPRSAREVLKRGEDVTFVVRALDPQRRGVELALPGMRAVSGTPSAEMIEAEVRLARRRQPATAKAVPTKAAVPARVPPRKASKPSSPLAPDSLLGPEPPGGPTTAAARLPGVRKPVTKKVAVKEAAVKKAAAPEEVPLGPAGSSRTATKAQGRSVASKRAAAAVKEPEPVEEPAATTPVVTKRAANKPDANKPVANKPVANKPAAVRMPAATKSVASKRAAAVKEPARSKAVAKSPAAAATAATAAPVKKPAGKAAAVKKPVIPAKRATRKANQLA